MPANCARSDAGFATLIERLTAYRDEHGNLLVPQPYRCADGFALGKAVNRLRSR